jgi:hypothetical protein
MARKYGFFRIPIALEKVYDTTLEFWSNKNGKIIEERNSSDKLIKILKIQRGLSLSSNGEQYLMNFKFNEHEVTTYVAIEVALSFGYGIQWLTPQKLIKQWGRQYGSYSSFNLIRNGNIDEFFDFETPPEVSKTIKNADLDVTSKGITQKWNKEEMHGIQPQCVGKNLAIPNTPKVILKFCNNCGAEVSEEHRFCVNCGYKLRDSIEL